MNDNRTRTIRAAMTLGGIVLGLIAWLMGATLFAYLMGIMTGINLPTFWEDFKILRSHARELQESRRQEAAKKPPEPEPFG